MDGKGEGWREIVFVKTLFSGVKLTTHAIELQGGFAVFLGGGDTWIETERC